MPATDSPSNSASPSGAVQRFSAVRMPIDAPVDDLSEAVEKLRTCSSTELRRARKHHRRALESLENGGYSALSEATRNHLARRLRNNLEALNRALDTPEESTNANEGSNSVPRSFSSRFRAFFRGLW